jgi:manganese/iron transport system substrate-binding protein
MTMRQMTILLAWTALLAACSTANPIPVATAIDALEPAQLPPSGRLQVAGTTTLVGDLLRQVGGEAIDLHVILSPGSDPHDYQATPGDMRAVSGTAAIFVNGFDLEGTMLANLADSFPDTPLVDLSQGIQPLGSSPSFDPHVWLDPLNVKHWAENAAQALGRLDPRNASIYAANAREYSSRLQSLDSWIRDELKPIPSGGRLLVTEHHMLDYFARRYGFTVVGTIVPGYSSEAEPSAKELAQLEDKIRSSGAGAIFIEQAANPQLAQTVAEDTGLKVVSLYVGALSRANGPAADYIALMQYDVQAIVQALLPHD